MRLPCGTPDIHRFLEGLWEADEVTSNPIGEPWVTYPNPKLAKGGPMIARECLVLRCKKYPKEKPNEPWRSPKTTKTQAGQHIQDGPEGREDNSRVIRNIPEVTSNPFGEPRVAAFERDGKQRNL